MRKLEVDRFNEAVEIIRREFPTLRLDIQHKHSHVDAMLDIPQQPGLLFAVNINLQNLDELHFSAGHFWVEWFPCGDKKFFDAFIQAVKGVLSGSYRIVEYYVGSVNTSAVLQRPAGGAWEAVTGRSSLMALIPWPRRQRVLQNKRVA